MSKEAKLEVIAEKPKLTANTAQTVNVLIRISAPNVELTDTNRPKLNLGIALDRSGSMDGAKMKQAREAAKYVVDQLLPHDIFSTVIFDDHVDVLFTCQAADDKRSIQRGIDRIEARGSTDLHGGWVQAGLQVSERLDPEAVNRILLITDGQANVGEVRTDRLVKQARGLAGRGVSTSTIGIGRDFNEDLLIPMGEAGGGNSWHVKEPQDMVKIFETEMHGLIKQIGHSVTLKVVTNDGVSVAEVLNDLEIDASGRYKLPNLQAGSTLDVVVCLRVPANSSGSSIELAAFEIEWVAQDTMTDETARESFTADFDSPEAVEAAAESQEVANAVRLLMNARARREAMNRIDEHDYEGARNILGSAAAETGILFCRNASPELKAEVEDLDLIHESVADDELMARKRMAYSAHHRTKGQVR